MTDKREIMITTLTEEELLKIDEPSVNEVYQYMRDHGENYYNSRERLREKAYGGLPPNGYQSWGDYWKAY